MMPVGHYNVMMCAPGPPSEPAGVFSPDVADVNQELSGTSLVLSWWPGADHGRVIQSYVVEGRNTYADYWERLKYSEYHLFRDRALQIYSIW